MRTIISALGSALLLAALVGASCARGDDAPLPALSAAPGQAPLVLESSVFQDGQAIPRRHSCDGENLSPALAWSGLPEGVVSLALLVDDPDAPGGTFVHWVLYNLPSISEGLDEGIAPGAALLSGGVQGINSWGQAAYGGPCPPSGTHHYRFTLLALDASLDLPSGANQPDVMRAAEGHLLAEAVLVGTYRR